MGLKSVEVPRNADDRQTVAFWQQNREAIKQLQDVAETYDVHFPMFASDRLFGSAAFKLTAGTQDTLIYTVPAATGRFQTWILSRAIGWLDTPLGASDTGTIQFRLGTTAGGNDIITDQPITAATTRKIIGGLSIASLGTAMLAANGYEAALDPGTTIYARATTTGTITAGSVLVGLYAYFEPL